MEERNLQAIDGATLMGLHLEPTRFCVDTLLPQGVCFLGGASKIGKSWMSKGTTFHTLRREQKSRKHNMRCLFPLFFA